MRIKRRRVRRLQPPWVTMRGPIACCPLGALGLEASERALWAHGTGAPVQAASLTSTRRLERLPGCAGVTAQPSRPLKLLQSRVQLGPCLVACHFCSDDGYGKT